MEKSKELIDQIQRSDFLSTYKEERNSRIKIKLLSLYHLQQGKTIKEVSEIVMYGRIMYTSLVMYVFSF